MRAAPIYLILRFIDEEIEKQKVHYV